MLKYRCVLNGDKLRSCYNWASGIAWKILNINENIPVSYTHLTLPTILLV